MEQTKSVLTEDLTEVEALLLKMKLSKLIMGEPTELYAGEKEIANNIFKKLRV